MMKVEIGNSHAIEGVREPDGAVRYFKMPGERITTLLIPEGTPLTEAFTSVVSIVPYHFERDRPPDWIRCDDEALCKLLCDHFKVPDSKPVDWGEKAVISRPSDPPSSSVVEVETEEVDA